MPVADCLGFEGFRAMVMPRATGGTLFNVVSAGAPVRPRGGGQDAIKATYRLYKAIYRLDKAVYRLYKTVYWRYNAI
jgi:hypothetical protein